MTLRSPRVRIVGHGNHLRLRALGDWEAHPIEALRECCRAETALEKAMWQTVNKAREASHSWTEIGNALGVTKQTAWQRFSGGLRHPITGEEINRESEPDAQPSRFVAQRQPPCASVLSLEPIGDKDNSVVTGLTGGSSG